LLRPPQDHVVEFWNEIDSDKDGTLMWNEFASRFPTALKFVHKKQHPKPESGIDWCELVLPANSRAYVAGRMKKLRMHAAAKAQIAHDIHMHDVESERAIAMSKDPAFVGKHIHAPDIVVQRAAESDSEEGAEKENAEDHKLTPFWYNKRTGKSITPSVEECLYQLCRESDADGSGDLDFDEYINMIHSPSLGLHLSISAFMGIKLWEAMQDLKDGTIFVGATGESR
jgi:hypothetical protein